MKDGPSLREGLGPLVLMVISTFAFNAFSRRPFLSGLEPPSLGLRLLQSGFAVQHFRPPTDEPECRPIKLLAGLIVREAHLKAAACRHSLVFDDENAVGHCSDGPPAQSDGPNIRYSRIVIAAIAVTDLQDDF